MPRLFPLLSSLLLCSLVLSAVTAHAQIPPDAGSLQQQIERERPLSLPPLDVPDRVPPPPEMSPEAISVTVKQFRFAGNTLLSDEQLAPVIAGFLDRPIDFNQLQAATVAVANAYREAGWIVRAYLPRQEIEDGIVTIQIVEAVFGRLHLEGETTRVKPAIVAARFGTRLEPGAPLSAKAIDRGLLLADDLPGVAVAGTLRPGTAEGETDLVIKLADQSFAIGEVTLDNAGSRATGVERVTSNITLASPLGLGDQLAANLLYSKGTEYIRLAYTLPLGNDGWRVGINGSLLNYQLISPEFKALNGKGDSSSMGLEANYPLIRSRVKNLYFRLTYDHRRFDNEANATIISNYQVDNVTVGLSGNLFDTLAGGGANAASLYLLQGRVDLDGSPNRPGDDATTRTHGSFSKLNYRLSRQQVITPELSLYAAWSGQWANTNLDSSEKFYLGGANGVRAFPSNEGGGSLGQMANLELRWRLLQCVTTTAFYDWGRIRQNVNNDFAGAAIPNSYRLKGYGLSLGWLSNSGLNIKATWARRDGSNPNSTLTGTDQDGSLDKHRWWFSASMPF